MWLPFPEASIPVDDVDANESYETILPLSLLTIQIQNWACYDWTNFHFLPAAALKTQPYDLLRWSAAYFRCLSLDVLPPVKPRYEHENVFGCLTKGYLKVLLSQVRLELSFHVMFHIGFLWPPQLWFMCIDDNAFVHFAFSFMIHSLLNINIILLLRSEKDSLFVEIFLSIVGTDYACLR